MKDNTKINLDNIYGNCCIFEHLLRAEELRIELEKNVQGDVRYTYDPLLESFDYQIQRKTIVFIKTVTTEQVVTLKTDFLCRLVLDSYKKQLNKLFFK